MKRTKLQNALVIALLLAMGAGTLSAYVLLSPTRRWASDPNVVVDNRGIPSISDGDYGVTRTRNAIVSTNAWNGAGSGTLLTASISSSVATSFSLGDGIPMLNFRNPYGTCSGSCLAATYTGYYTGSTIYDADIVTNYNGYAWASAGEACSSEIYVEGVMVHEVGHLLGLGHTNVGGATMYPSVAYCNNGPASTEADDENGVNFLY